MFWVFGSWEHGNFVLTDAGGRVEKQGAIESVNSLVGADAYAVYDEYGTCHYARFL